MCCPPRKRATSPCLPLPKRWACHTPRCIATSMARRGCWRHWPWTGTSVLASPLNQAIDGQRGQGLLRATAVTYCAFARGEPALFRAMFHPLLRDKSKFPELEAQAALSFQSLGAIVQDLKGASTIEARLTGAIIWSCLHGVAALESDAWLPGRTDYARAISSNLAGDVGRCVVRRVLGSRLTSRWRRQVLEACCPERP